LGTTSTKNLKWKLKTVKRYNTTLPGINLTNAVAHDTDYWMALERGTTAANKF